jgi:hypothetical protein
MRTGSHLEVPDSLSPFAGVVLIALFFDIQIVLSNCASVE